MRKLAFENEYGDRYSINGEHDIYSTALSGFGYSKAPSVENLGSGFFAETDTSKEPQQTIGFTLTFTQDAYAAYERLLDWINNQRVLYLVYIPLGGVEYIRRVTVRSIAKTELTMTRWLEVPITLSCLTPWAHPAALAISMTGLSPYAKRFPHRYPYRYGSSAAGAYAADINPDGHLPAAIRFVYRGAVVNPVLTLSGASGTIYGRCAITTSLEATDTLEISSLAQDSYVRKISGDGIVTDLIDVVARVPEVYPRAPVNEACTLRFAAADTPTGKATAYVYYYRRTV